ncbi:hypothetical protein ACLOJK_040332 [Asimina triloba]
MAAIVTTLFSHRPTLLVRLLLQIQWPHIPSPISPLLQYSIAIPLISSPYRFFSHFSSSPHPPLQTLSDDVNQISRVLSDYRSPHHDIESALTPFASIITIDSVEQVLKRCRNLGVSAHRFFLWARNLPGFSHSPDSYNILCDILGSCKQFPLMWDFLAEMRDEGVEIRPEIFWVIFRAYCRAGLPADALRAFGKMADFGLHPAVDDVDKLISFLCRSKHLSHAQEFLKRVSSEFKLGPKTYSILMQGFGDCGKSDEALKVFDEMRERECCIDVVAYNTLLEALCRGGNVDEASKRFREMGSYGLKPNSCSYAAFINAACGENDVHSALRILDRMRRYELIPSGFTHYCIIKLLCKNKMIDDAYKLMDEMSARGVAPNVWTYNAILEAHCNLREVNRALRILVRMKKNCCPPDRHTYNMLLKMLIGEGRIDRAMEVWDGMAEQGFYPSVTTYSVMIHGLCKKKGRIEDACRYFEMMVDEGIPPYSATCNLLRVRLLQIGLRERVYILAEKMRQSTSCSIQELSEVMISSQALPKKRDRSCSESNGEDWSLS